MRQVLRVDIFNSEWEDGKSPIYAIGADLSGGPAFEIKTSEDFPLAVATKRLAEPLLDEKTRDIVFSSEGLRFIKLIPFEYHGSRSWSNAPYEESIED
jgi:hypothetical protein